MRIFVAVVALIVLVFAPSCEGDYVDCEIDSTFSGDEALEIQRAVDDWTVFASSRSPRVVDRGEWLILTAPVPGGWLGYAQGRRKLIRISPETPDNEVYAVALHELGHALGLGHVTKGVMDKSKQTIQFSDEDFAECQRAGACP
jgi:hypothetical protein